MRLGVLDYRGFPDRRRKNPKKSVRTPGYILHITNGSVLVEETRTPKRNHANAPASSGESAAAALGSRRQTASRGVVLAVMRSSTPAVCVCVSAWAWCSWFVLEAAAAASELWNVEARDVHEALERCVKCTVALDPAKTRICCSQKKRKKKKTQHETVFHLGGLMRRRTWYSNSTHSGSTFVVSSSSSMCSAYTAVSTSFIVYLFSGKCHRLRM